MKKILIIDDDRDLCLLLSKLLVRKGYETEVVHSAAKGIAKIKETPFDVVFCDFRLGDKDGREVLAEIKSYAPATIVIIITGYSDTRVAVDVIKHGAFDYITKPLAPDEIMAILTNALASAGKEPEMASPAAKPVPGKASNTHPKISAHGEYLVGEAATTKGLYDQIKIVAPTSYSIILYGESGTGKEVIAKTIHSLSSRNKEPFIAIDCGTLSKELAGSELFGHVKGAFTGALSDKVGHFELAHGGTLFLDEVANLSYPVQATLLRVIQERKFKRVGGNKEMPVDVRIIVASNENLQEAYQKGKFREDLYHRFNEFSINLPPLRERQQDIPLFAEFFLQKSNQELDKQIEGYDDEVMEMFLTYSWPGNLREFRNVVRRAVLLTASGKVTAKTLPWEITSHSASPLQQQPISYFTHPNEENNLPIPDLKDAATKAEYETIMKVLKQVKFNKTKAAEILNIDRKTLYNKIKSFEDLSS